MSDDARPEICMCVCNTVKVEQFSCLEAVLDKNLEH